MNSISDVTGNTTFSITAGAGGSWSGNVYTSQYAGNWTVTGTYGEIPDIATLMVAPPPPPPLPPTVVISVVVTPGNATVSISGTQQFTATAYYSNGASSDVTSSATWSSGNISVATVSADLATAVAMGSTSITATYGGKSGSASLTVTAAVSPPVVSIEVIPGNTTIAVGQTQAFQAMATYEGGAQEDVTDEAAWAIGNITVATISAGNATGVGVGTTGITAKYGNVTSNTAALTVRPATVRPAVITGITINTGGSVEVGGTKQLTAVATYSDGSSKDVTGEVTWSSSDSGIATIDPTGLATGISVGDITVTAAFGGVSGSATLSVTPSAIVSIVVTPASASIPVKGQQQFTATAMYANGNSTDVTAKASWASSKENVATVVAGLASAKAAGTTDITATLSNVRSNLAALTVAVGVRRTLIGGIIGAVLAAGLLFFLLMRRRRRKEEEGG